MTVDLPAHMPAPCGITCLACYVHLRKKKPCLGCRGQDEGKPAHCRQCKIKHCAAARGVDFCCECPSFPCALVKRLDKSYRQRYRISLIENALRLKVVGAPRYWREERARWTCAACGGIVSLHDGVCSACGQGGSNDQA